MKWSYWILVTIFAVAVANILLITAFRRLDVESGS
jgi:hypothetical protein